MACRGAALPFYSTLFHLHLGLQNGLFFKVFRPKILFAKERHSPSEFKFRRFFFYRWGNIPQDPLPATSI
jgi:hypothetical protein